MDLLWVSPAALEHLLEPAAAPRGSACVPVRGAVQAVLPVGFGFAGGAMVWVVLSELLPEARAELSASRLTVWLGGSLLAMSLFQLALLGH